MNQKTKTIDCEWLTKPTGDPFADTGGYAIEYLFNRPTNKEKDILQLIKEVANIYIKRWNAGLHVFFLNSTITQSAKGFQTHEEKFSKTVGYFESILNESASNIEGTCRIIGERTKLFKAGRENSILTGSGTFLNFHHNMEAGIMLSKEAIIRFFFVPIASEMIYDKMGILHSNQIEVVRHFVQNNVSKNLKNSVFNFALRSNYHNPATALFAFVDNLISDVPLATDNTQKLSLTLLHFSNFATSPNIDIYKIPANLFDFYRFCRYPKYTNHWQKFVNANYVKYLGYSSKFDVASNSYNEAVKEFSVIKNVTFNKLKKDKSLNFSLSKFGERTDPKTKENYYVVNTDELNNWKQNKIFKVWKETHNAGAKELTKATKKVKDERILNYGLKDYTLKWINRVYNSLMVGNSLLQLILKWNEENPFEFRITKTYQILIRNMNTKTLDLIEKITDYLIIDESDLKKKKRTLQTSNGYELRSFLIKQIEKNYNEGSDEPLVTLRDYVGYLFPEGTNWSEIRDLMLICFFQKLHEKGVKIEVEEESDLTSQITDESNNDKII